MFKPGTGTEPKRTCSGTGTEHEFLNQTGYVVFENKITLFITI